MKRMKGETLKMYRVITAFSKATIVPNGQWSFVHAGLRLNPDNLFASLTVNPEIVFERIAIPEIPIEEAAQRQWDRRSQWMVNIADDAGFQFLISSQAHVNKAAGACPFVVM
jgi:hypothetical protein